jgi:hypothetical protein
MSTEMICIRVLADEDKGEILAQAICGLSNGTSHAAVHMIEPTELRHVPGSPFAYWIPKKVRQLFVDLPAGETESRRFNKGLCTTYDARFVRVFWEIQPADFGRLRKWSCYANGGTYSPFYFEYPAVVLTEHGFKELSAYLIAKFPYLGGDAGWLIHDENGYLAPVIAWPLRAHSFSPHILPAEFVFSARTYAAFVPVTDLRGIVAFLSSKPVDYLLKVSLGRIGHPEFVNGVLRSLPFPDFRSSLERLDKLTVASWAVLRSLDTAQITSHAAVAPALIAVGGKTLSERASAWSKRVASAERELAKKKSEIDELALRLYGLEANDLGESKILSNEDTDTVDDDDGDLLCSNGDLALVGTLIDHLLGCAFGHWDIRYATGEKAAPELPDPFAPLPVCPPGMLQNVQGLPLEKSEVQMLLAARKWDYPIEIPWDGILVDDPGHLLDIEGRVRQIIEIIWKDRADAIEHEACEIVGVKSLREYYRKPSAFFADHLRRYSKSRRQAPIYWPLSTVNGSYTLWIYYPRLNDQTLFQCVNEFVKPKLEEVRRDVDRLQIKLRDAGTAKERQQLQDSQDLLAELTEFHDELLRVAGLPYNPNLNDGVLITACPLWKLFRLPKWQKELKACWDDLSKGEYDWAHLAYTIWPDRVKDACKKDRSIAIAHGLEDLCQVKAPEKKGKRQKQSNRQGDLI